MGRPIKKGSTDQSTVIRIIDATDGTPEQAVEHDTSGIALWWRREGETITAITEAALASLDAAHSDGGIEHIDDGYYRLDLPDAAVAAGAGENGVMVGGGVTGMIVIGTYHPLIDYDPNDSVRLGLTALPNAAADAAGGLPISDAGGLDLDTKLANTNEITAARMGALTDWINAGRLDLILDELTTQGDTNETKLDTIDGVVDTVLIDTAELQTDDVPGLIAALNNPTVASIADGVWDEAQADHVAAGSFGLVASEIADILVDTAVIGALGAGLSNIPWNASWDAEVQSEVTDALNTYDPPTKAEVDAIWSLTEDVTGDTHTYKEIMARLYSHINNEMNITDATGYVELRNAADSAEMANCTVTDNATVTQRTELTWA